MSPASTFRAGGGRDRRHHRRRRAAAPSPSPPTSPASPAVERRGGRTMAEFGGIDILHNNVGVGDRRRAAGARRGAIPARARSQYRLGLPHRQGRAAALLERRGGAIVNISSLAAIRWTGYPYFAYYAAKAAVVQATTAIALQYACQGIRANCILPGLIDTPLIYHADLRQLRVRRGDDRSAQPPRCRWARWAPPGTSPPRRFPRLGRGEVHHRGRPAGRWRAELRGADPALICQRFSRCPRRVGSPMPVASKPPSTARVCPVM